MSVNNSEAIPDCSYQHPAPFAVISHVSFLCARSESGRSSAQGISIADLTAVGRLLRGFSFSAAAEWEFGPRAAVFQFLHEGVRRDDG